MMSHMSLFFIQWMVNFLTKCMFLWLCLIFFPPKMFCKRMKWNQCLLLIKVEMIHDAVSYGVFFFFPFVHIWCFPAHNRQWSTDVFCSCMKKEPSLQMIYRWKLSTPPLPFRELWEEYCLRAFCDKRTMVSESQWTLDEVKLEMKKGGEFHLSVLPTPQ